MSIKLRTIDLRVYTYGHRILKCCILLMQPLNMGTAGGLALRICAYTQNALYTMLHVSIHQLCIIYCYHACMPSARNVLSPNGGQPLSPNKRLRV